MPRLLRIELEVPQPGFVPRPFYDARITDPLTYAIEMCERICTLHTEERVVITKLQQTGRILVIEGFTDSSLLDISKLIGEPAFQHMLKYWGFIVDDKPSNDS